MAKRTPNAQSESAQEEWRSVVGWEGMYEVSDLGRVRSLDRDTKYRCFCGHGEIIRKKKGKVLKPTYNIGYPNVQLTDGDRRERWLVHRLVCIAFHGPAPAGKDQVAHGDGNPANARADNLRWANCRENMADKWGHGTMLTGDDCSWAKLSDEQVQQMRRSPEITNGAWAAKLGVSENHVSKIMVGALRSKPSGQWVGEWLNKADRLPYGGLTVRDKAFIIAHPEMSRTELASRFDVSVRRITMFRSENRAVRRRKNSYSQELRDFIALNPENLKDAAIAERWGITTKQVQQIRYSLPKP